MSIPVTASTEAFAPASMAEIEGAPTFTFRHATVLDKTRFHELKAIARLRNHGAQEMRDVVLHELRKMFTSEGMAQNITRLEAYWAAIDEHEGAIKAYREQVIGLFREAGDGEKPELPPEPELDFPAGEVIELNALVDEVERHSEIYAAMRVDNIRFEVGYPRLLMRMFLTGTDLPVELKRDRDGILTPETGEAVIEALAKAARAADLDPDVAVQELLFKSVIAFTLTGDEEKNSSSPLSGISSPKQSASKASSGNEPKSNDPAISEETDGLRSSDSDNLALA
jgi:hypothetical protein